MRRIGRTVEGRLLSELVEVLCTDGGSRNPVVGLDDLVPIALDLLDDRRIDPDACETKEGGPDRSSLRRVEIGVGDGEGEAREEGWVDGTDSVGRQDKDTRVVLRILHQY